MEEFRKNIDKIDENIIKLLASRRREVQMVAEYKAKNGIPTFQPDRELILIEKVRRIAEKEGLDVDFIEQLFRFILESSKRQQDQYRDIA